ncbi:hypothetical protein DFJ74DRAFT_677919 [Hyaloraphidium curvatum]|nr:hypothetical protein DFJ74DRAFT_677919 [Hyaloraphidium curvatum]
MLSGRGAREAERERSERASANPARTTAFTAPIRALAPARSARNEPTTNNHQATKASSQAGMHLPAARLAAAAGTKKRATKEKRWMTAVCCCRGMVQEAAMWRRRSKRKGSAESLGAAGAPSPAAEPGMPLGTCPPSTGTPVGAPTISSRAVLYPVSTSASCTSTALHCILFESCIIGGFGRRNSTAHSGNRKARPNTRMKAPRSAPYHVRQKTGASATAGVQRGKRKVCANTVMERKKVSATV